MEPCKKKRTEPSVPNLFSRPGTLGEGVSCVVLPSERQTDWIGTYMVIIIQNLLEHVVNGRLQRETDLGQLSTRMVGEIY
ncbi:hypothetical protein AKJ16_DCAP07378 [Drosera capensis]